MTLFLDSHGAIGLEVSLLIAQSVPTELKDLNSKELPDVYYLGHSGKTFGVEIKQPGELLGSLSDVEEQLAREYGQVDSLSLCVAGVVLPSERGCSTLRWSADGRSGWLSGTGGGRPFSTSYDAYRSWLRSVAEWGITVYEMPNKLALARHLVACYNHDQKAPEEHKTFRRPLRTRKPMGSWNPYVLTLMGLIDLDTGRTFLGPERAQAALDVYGTPANVMLAAQRATLAKEVEGLGKVTEGKIARSVGL